MSCGLVLHNFEVVEFDVVKDGGHHHGAVSFDLRQQGFSPAGGEKEELFIRSFHYHLHHLSLI